MKTKTKIQDLKPIAQGKFVKPTKEEIERDRKQFIDTKMAEIVQTGYSVNEIFVSLSLIESRIKLRKVQLKSGEIKEQFNGMIMPKYMLEAELEIDKLTFNKFLRSLNEVKDKLKAEKFTEDDIKLMSQNNFDWTAWRKKYQEEYNKK